MQIKLIIGLGNPGETYEKSYHNAGLLGLEYLRQKLNGGEFTKPSHQGNFAYSKIGSLILIHPKTFMNESGIAAIQALNYFKVPPTNLIVLQDEADLSIGSWRLEFGRNSAGHHGIDSITEQIGSKAFWRCRIGIRRKQDGENSSTRKKAGEFVLSQISQDDWKALQGVFEEVSQAITNDIVNEEAP